MSGRNVRQWWPWLILAVGAVLIATGGFLFSPGVAAPPPAIAATATS